MLRINNKCTGCSTCVCVCPTGAIGYEIRAGFRYPVINKEKCLNCGLCEKKCPAANKEKNINEIRHVYAAWSKNEAQREVCTSGGVCYELSKYILENGGCVAGVAWTTDYKDAYYELIDELKDLPMITQTKYFQPQMNDIFLKVKSELEKKKTVLFIGTACLNAGLRQYLSKGYDNLICCDFICRGYTSQLYHEKRVEDLEKKNNSVVCGIQYKNKSLGWKNFGTKFDFENGNSIYVNRHSDPYELMFAINDYNTRPSCYACKYRQIPRLADITVGDFWGIENIDPEEEMKGISAVMTFSDKGDNLFHALSDKMVLEERTIAEISKGNYALLHQLKRESGAGKFFDDLSVMNMTKFHDKYASKRKIYMKKAVLILKHLIRCNIFLFIKYNFLCKSIKRRKRKYIIPYYGSRLDIRKGSEVILNENILLNTPKHRCSNEQMYLKVMKGGRMEINGKVNLAANSTVEVLPNAVLKMGRTETNYNTTIICSNEISIGNDVAIGRNVVIYDSNYHPTSINGNSKMKPLIIKDHVWICSGVIIAKGLTINEGAICSLNSMITRNVKSRTMMMGNPAKAVMTNVEW